MYKLTITHKEYRALAYMSAKGYDCGMFEALADESVKVTSVGADAEEYDIPEHVIWPVCDLWREAVDLGDQPWGPFAEYDLQRKMDDLIMEVV
jgi:hypothetical protein